MAYEIVYPGDFIPDDELDGRYYPIEDQPRDTVVMYSKEIQPTNFNTANLVAVFHEWFTSFFPANYFKFVRIKTQSPFSEFKSFMKRIYKVEKPFLVIDPQPIEMEEESIFAQNMLNRYNHFDPEHENIGPKLVYSTTIMESDLFELVYRRNRMRCEFNIMIMEQTQNRQADVYNMMIMRFRHNSKFMLVRTLPLILPKRYIVSAARLHGYDWKSDEFVKFLNSISRYPIRKEIRTNGQIMFLMLQEIHIYVEIPRYPSRDSAENSEAIEWGARVVDSFTFTADLPMEYVFLVTKEHAGLVDRGMEDDPDSVSFISPIYADMDWPTEYGDFKLVNRIDIELQEGDERTLNILEHILPMDADIHSLMNEYIARGGDINDMVMVRVYPNGSMKEIGVILHKNGILELTSAKTNKLYTINAFVNYRVIHLIEEGREMKFTGSIEHDMHT